VRVEKDPTTRHHSLLFSDDVVDLAREADIMFLNLECCISEHDERWPNPHKP
jgi:poly-gamma-glutamate synthesis protein (capsule biosynthesis protein)